MPSLAKNGVVLATENRSKSILYEEQSIFKVESITDHIGMVYSGMSIINSIFSYLKCNFHSIFLSPGMGPDYRVLVKKARKMAQEYYRIYDEPIPTAQLVQRVALVMQEYTQSGYVTNPFRYFTVYCKFINFFISVV